MVPWSKFVILCDHISWTLQLTDMELVLWERANMMCWSIGTSALDLELRAHKINHVWWFDIGNCVRLYLLNPTTMGMELTFIDPANVGILQWQSHHVELWAYECLLYFMNLGVYESGWISASLFLHMLPLHFLQVWNSTHEMNHVCNFVVHW